MGSLQIPNIYQVKTVLDNAWRSFTKQAPKPLSSNEELYHYCGVTPKITGVAREKLYLNCASRLRSRGEFRDARTLWSALKRSATNLKIRQQANDTINDSLGGGGDLFDWAFYSVIPTTTRPDLSDEKVVGTMLDGATLTLAWLSPLSSMRLRTRVDYEYGAEVYQRNFDLQADYP